MTASTSIADPLRQQSARPASWRLFLAFSVIYLVWGSTFLAIRIGVQEIPPLLMAGMRFAAAGAMLYGWCRLTGTPSPSAREWRAISLLAVMIFVCDYGLLFWAEQRVPSGIAAVMLATIPVFMTLFEIGLLKTRRMSAGLAIALAIGIGGVAVLVNRSMSLGEAPIEGAGAMALVIAALSWSAGSALMKKLPLPSSKMMSSAAQMLSGGVMLLLISGVFGEYRNFHLDATSRGAWLALAYLIVAGSILGFTAYLWLLHHESPTKVGTYAYVNPVVAVLVGYFLGGETLGMRTILGSLLVLISVIVITTLPSKKPLRA